MGIYYSLYPVDPSHLQENQAWFYEYMEERDDAVCAWSQDEDATPDDPSRYLMVAYEHRYVDLINTFLETMYGIEPYSWFAGEQVEFSEHWFVTSPDKVAALADTLSGPATNAREKLLGLPLDNLDLVGTFVPREGYQAIGTTLPGTVDQFWELMESLHTELRTLYRGAAENGQAMIGHFSG